MAQLKDLFEINKTIEAVKTVFDNISECINLEDVIITKRNIKITFKGYISQDNIQKLQSELQIDSFIIKVHNYEKQEIVFTYNSEFKS